MNKSKLKDEEFCWKIMKKKEFNEMETGLNNYKKKLKKKTKNKLFKKLCAVINFMWIK